MSTIAGLLLFLAAGWLLVRRTGLARGDVVFDVSLGWFVGSGYFALAYITAIEMQIPVRPLSSLVIICLPFLLLLKGGSGDWRAFRVSAVAAYGALRGSANALRPHAPLMLLAVIAVAIMALQGMSTPPVADDVVRVRLAEPVSQYFNEAVSLSQGFENSLWANYVPQLFWHMGGLNLFTLQYMVMYTVVFFLILIFQSLVLEKRYRAAAYALFIPAALPFFIFHGTVSHLDIVTACFFGLGFFFFHGFTREGDGGSFYTALIFFTLTFLLKNSSDTLAFIGLGFLAVALFAHVWRGGHLPIKKTIFFSLPLLMYLVLKEIAQPSNQLPTLLNHLLATPRYLAAPSVGGVPGPAPVWNELLPGVWYSLFSSGHFGVLFYALGASMVIFSRKIFFSRQVWGVGLLLAVLGGMVAYYLFEFNDPMAQQAQISRAMLTPAVATALFLALLWGDEAAQ